MTQDAAKSKNGTTVIEALLSGSASSAITTVIYQPLELIKTRLQLRQFELKDDRIFGRAVYLAKQLTQGHGPGYLWVGTRASLLRSVPGVGLYYGSLTALQRNFSIQNNSPDNALQAFFFGLTARSFVSIILLPVTVIKVRYESGQYNYGSLASAVRDSYSRTGWVGLIPTLLRDSLFSGIYYMLYTKLKATYVSERSELVEARSSIHIQNFACGSVSGLVASVLTNPIDVVKTNMQIVGKKKTMSSTVVWLVKKDGGLLRLLDGMILRSTRRTLIAATTWTLFELFQN